MLRAADCGYGVMLPSFDPFRTGAPPLLAGAALAEELGFDSGWVGDHLSFHMPLVEALTALAGAAGCTSRLRLGTGVLLLGMRHPVWTAKQLGSLDALAPGRVLFGVGAGGENPAEWEVAGVPVGERGRRVDEGLAVVTALLRGEAVDHAGPLLPTRSPALEPAPSVMPPVIVGGRSDAALRRAARFGDGWLGVWLSPRRVAEVGASLASLAAEYGRPAPSMLMMVFVHVTDSGDTGREEAAAMIAGQYGMAFERVARWTLVGSEAEVAEGLAALVAAGAAGFVLVPAAADPLAQYHRFAAVRALL